MHYEGVLLGLCTFLIIGAFHPVVIKSEYYFGTRVWWIFLVVGLGFLCASLFIASLFLVLPLRYSGRNQLMDHLRTI